jgi:two-component system response regulator NreC
MVRVLIADGYPAVRRGMRALLSSEADMEVVGEAGSSQEAVRLAQELSPDVVLTETRGPMLDGLRAAREIKRLQPNVAIVFLTQDESPFYFFEALRHGCEGYIPKSAEPGEVVAAIRCAVRGERYIHPSMARWLVNEFVSRNRGQQPGPPKGEFSSRELQILELIAAGLTNREIASSLNLSINTIRYHRARLMDKVGARTTGELIRCALQRGLLQA